MPSYLEGQPLQLLSGKKTTHLGDGWASCNGALYVAAGHGLNKLIAQTNKYNINIMRDIFSSLDCGGIEVEVVKSPSVSEYDHMVEMTKLGYVAPHNYMFLYARRFTPSKITWDVSKVKKKICYGFKAGFKAHNKTPPNIDGILSHLKEMYPGFEFLHLTHPMTINDYIEHLSTCYFYIGLDQGIGHINRSVGAPMFIIRYKHDIERCYIPEFCDYKCILFNDPDLKNTIGSYLDSLPCLNGIDSSFKIYAHEGGSYLEGATLQLNDWTTRVHLGDGWAACSSALSIAFAHNLKKLVCKTNRKSVDKTRDMFNALDKKGVEISVVSGDNYDGEYEVIEEMKKAGLTETNNYACRFVKAKDTWNVSKIEKKICYGFEAKYKIYWKTPPNLDEILQEVKDMYPGFEFLHLTSPHNIEDYVRELSTCYFYIGLDQGIGHVNRSVGAPMFIIRFGHDIEKCFIPEFCDYKCILFNDPDIESTIKDYLGLVPGLPIL